MFEDNYKQQVMEAIQEDCNNLEEKLNHCSESIQKQKKMEFIQRKRARFPGLSWFLQQKPKETKTRSDHCTGLCRDCEEPQLNYETLRKFKKSICVCGTKKCPNHICSCEPAETGELTDECDCDPCYCNDCQKCQVILIHHIFVCMKVKS